MTDKPESNFSEEQRSGSQMTRRSSRGRMQRGEPSSPFPSSLEFFSNPFATMRRMHEDMDRMFAGAFGGGLLGGSEGSAGGGLAAWSPAIEVRQHGNELTVCAELPGLKPEEVQVEVNEDVLVIQGERRQEKTHEDRGTHRTERRYGRFYRAVPLPDGVHAEQAKASFQNGVLEVRVPMPEQQSRRRQIPIEGASGNRTPDGGGGGL